MVDAPEGADRNANPRIMTFGTPEQQDRHARMRAMVRDCPVPDSELARNMGMFLVPQTLSRVLFMDFLYRSILDVQGVVMEFGCRWGQNLSLFTALRGIHEPFNRLRRVIGFDSFTGFPATAAQDGALVGAGDYATTENYEWYLAALLRFQDAESPQAHIRKHEIIKGDVTHTVPKFFEDNPATVLALLYFDLDIYEPTKACLRQVKDRVTKGAVIGFDEVNDETTPGETLALIEELGLPNVRLKRWPQSARTSYLIVE